MPTVQCFLNFGTMKIKCKYILLRHKLCEKVAFLLISAFAKWVQNDNKLYGISAVCRFIFRSRNPGCESLISH